MTFLGLIVGPGGHSWGHFHAWHRAGMCLHLLNGMESSVGMDCQHWLPVQKYQSGCILYMDDFCGNGHAFPKKASSRRKLKMLGVCLKSGHLVHPATPAPGDIGGC